MSKRTFRLGHVRLLAAVVAMLVFAGIPSVAAPPTQDIARVMDANLTAPMRAGGQIPVVIRFRSAPTEADAAAMRDAGFRAPFIRYTVVPAVSAAGSAEAIKKLAANPRVAYIEHDEVVPYALDRATKAGRAQPVWDAIYRNASGVHTGGITGRGVGIAIVDTGVDATHADLLWKPLAVGGRQAKTVANYKLVGRDSAQLADASGLGGFVEANMLAIDMPHTDNTGGHGTHVAGIAGGLGTSSGNKYKGAAPGANIIGFGAGEALSISLGLAAFDYIHQHHDDPALNIRVVNNSWGGPGDFNPERSVTKAALRLVDDGLVVVFSAGNDGGDGSAIQTSVWGNIPSDGIVMVGNYYDRTGWVDDSSSRGLRTLERTWPDLSGPGTQIISTSATAGPVTYVGTGQDALIAGLEGYDEPVVASMPAAMPATVEEGGVVVGPYASFTGTSMSAPFIAGVVALILEANPALTPAQVRTILRETATMPPNRSYAADGFAIGKGVVDAAEAVAVALRATQLPLSEALGAYANLSTSPAELNVDEPRRLRINAPGVNDQVSGLTVVDGDFIAGPVTDQTIPLMPPPASPVNGNPRIYQAGALDPFALGGHQVVAGTFVDLSVRGITSSDGTIVVNTSTIASASHRVTQNGQTVFGPFVATVSADGANTQTNNEWAIPADAPPGDYVFEGSVTLTNSNTYVTGKRSFSIVGPPAIGGAARVEGLDGPVPATTSAGETTFFADDFEAHTPGDTRGWTIENNGLAHGLLTEWSLVNEDEVVLGGFGVGGGKQSYAAHLWAASPTVSSMLYTDLADTDLISPPIDLGPAGTASLEFMNVGLSELDYDFMRVFVAEDGSSQWAQLAEYSGDFLEGGQFDWQTHTLDLSAFAGKVVRVRFGFTSDDFSTSGNIGGWLVDDVRVTGTLGQGEVVIVPSFTASATSGTGSLDTVLSYSATAGTTPIDLYTIDFGDGSPVHTDTNAGTIAHTYGPGQYTATLAVNAGGETETATLDIDVAPTGEVQVRIAGGPWVDAGPASTVNAPFEATLDLTGLPLGPALIEARHIGADGVTIRTTRMVEIV